MENVLTKTQRRLAIVADAMAQVKAGLYVTGQVGYFILSNHVLDLASISDDMDNAQDILLQNKIPCGVCAQGSLFLSAIRKENGMSFYQMSSANHEEIMDKLMEDQLFEKNNLDLVEIYYEARNYPASGKGGWRLGQRFNWLFGADDTSEAYERHHEIGKRFVQAYPRGENAERGTRLVAILENMLENEGIFAPFKIKF